MTPKECEAKFQLELANYRQTGNPKSWEWVWICVQECCSNTIKSKAKGLVIPDFDGKVTDSVIKVMEKMQNGWYKVEGKATSGKRITGFCSKKWLKPVE